MMQEAWCDAVSLVWPLMAAMLRSIRHHKEGSKLKKAVHARIKIIDIKCCEGFLPWNSMAFPQAFLPGSKAVVVVSFNWTHHLSEWMSVIPEGELKLTSSWTMPTTRYEAIMFQKLSIMLLSSAPKITYYAFKKMPIMLKIMLANNVVKFIAVLEH